jgi:replication-associated recombination protein RarA
MELLTQLGHPIGVSVSAMQKAIRRGDAMTACHFAVDLARSNYWRYLWERLLIISAEDVSVSEPVTQEIVALANSYASTVQKRPRVIFVAKAVLILARANKCRDVDHLCVLSTVTKDQEAAALAEAAKEPCEVPAYAYDCHTAKGKRAGKSKDQFIVEEFDGLHPREQGEFDSLISPIRARVSSP